MSSLYISHQLSAISFQESRQTEGWSLKADGIFPVLVYQSAIKRRRISLIVDRLH